MNTYMTYNRNIELEGFRMIKQRHLTICLHQYDVIVLHYVHESVYDAFPCVVFDAFGYAFDAFGYVFNAFCYAYDAFCYACDAFCYVYY